MVEDGRRQCVKHEKNVCGGDSLWTMYHPSNDLDAARQHLGCYRTGGSSYFTSTRCTHVLIRPDYNCHWSPATDRHGGEFILGSEFFSSASFYESRGQRRGPGRTTSG